MRDIDRNSAENNINSDEDAMMSAMMGLHRVEIHRCCGEIGKHDKERGKHRGESDGLRGESGGGRGESGKGCNESGDGSGRGW